MTPNLAQLKHALAIAEKIEALQSELASIMGGSSISITASASTPAPVKKQGGMSAAGRARVAAAQKARWAKLNGETSAPAKAPKAKGKAKRTMSPEARAKIGAAQKARWAKVKKAKS